MTTPTPTDTDIDPVIPDDLAAALRRAAAAVPPADLDPTAPALRLRGRRRHHRLMAAAGGVAAAVTAIVALNLASGSDKPPVATVDPSATPETEGGGTPLLLPDGDAELLPDGTVRPLPKAQPDDVVWYSVRLTDGRVATLAARPSAEHPAMTPGPISDLAANPPSILAVFDADGALLGEEDISRTDHAVTLAGEFDGDVVAVYSRNDTAETMWTGTELVAIDPSTFESTRLAPSEGSDPRGTAAGGRAAVTHVKSLPAIDEMECWADVFELPGDQARRVDLPGCFLIWDTQLSPDGRHLAIVVDTAHASITGDGQTTMQVIDVASGQVVASTPVPNPCRGDGNCTLEARQAITWDGNDTAAAVIETTTWHGPGEDPPADRHVITATIP